MSTFEERITDSSGIHIFKTHEDAIKHRDEQDKRLEKLGIPIPNREPVKDREYFKKRMLDLINKYVRN